MIDQPVCCTFAGFLGNVALLRLSAEDVADIADLMVLLSTPVLLWAIVMMAAGTRSAAFSVGFGDRKSLLAALDAAARKIGLGLHALAEDRFLLPPRSLRRLRDLPGDHRMSLTFKGLADRSEAVIAGPALLVRRFQKEFPGAVSLPSPGSLGFPWRGLFFRLGAAAVMMGMLALFVSFSS